MLLVRSYPGNCCCLDYGPCLFLKCFSFFLFLKIRSGIGTVAFDARLGLYEDHPPEEALRFIKAVEDFFTLSHKLLFSAASRFARQYIDTPALKKFFKCCDDIFEIGLGFVEKKMKEIKEMDEKETDQAANNQSMFLRVFVNSSGIQ